MKIRLAGLVDDSIVDGPGYRFTVFVQGCRHHCAGCHNPATHDPDGGYEGDTDEIFSRLRENPLLQGVTFSGGEPFDQPVPLAELGQKIKACGLDLWIYTGYTYEELLSAENAAGFVSDRDFSEQKKEFFLARHTLLALADVLVDGPFRYDERDISLAFRGSRNQRIIDLNATRAAEKIVELALDKF